MAIPLNELSDLVRNGGGASVDAGDYLPGDLIAVAQAASAKAMLVIRNAEQILQAQRIRIARAAAGAVRFEL
jgi:hypothetical protein